MTLSTGYENSGALAFAMSTGIIFASIALYKIRTFQVSDLTNEYSAQNYISFRIITILCAAAFCLIYLALTTHNNTFFLVSLLYLVFKADETFSDVLYGIEQRNNRMDYIGKSQLMRGGASLIGFTLPLAVTGNLYFAIAGMAISCMAITVGYDIRHARLFGPIKPSISKKSALSLGKACFLAMVASLCANSIVSIVRQYFGLSCGSEALGIYASVATPAVLVQIAATYLYSPMIGSLAKSWQTDGKKAFAKQFYKILLIIIAIIGLLIAILSQIGAPFLNLVFGDSIAPYTYLFPFVLIATGCIGILFYINDVLIVIRKTFQMFICNLIALAVSIIGAMVLVPTFDMNGINFAIIVSAFVGSCLGFCFILRAQKHHQIVR